MRIHESQVESVRLVYWDIPNEGSPPLFSVIDDFLEAAISVIPLAHCDASAQWLELSFWPSSGRIIVYATDDGPFGDRDGERVNYSLNSSFIEDEFMSFEFDVDSDPSGKAFEAKCNQMLEPVYSRVRESLTSGKAAKALEEARKKHPLKLAIYEYDPREGLFPLKDMLPVEFFVEYEKYLEWFKSEHGDSGWL